MVSLFLLLGCNLSYIVDLFAALHELASANACTLLKRSEVPLMYSTEAYILFSLADSSETLETDPVFGIVSIQLG